MKQKDFNQIFVNAVSSKNNLSSDVLSQIKDGPVLSAASALEVYREDYEARLTEALKNTYRAINAIIGDEDFFILSKNYIKQYHSHSPDLDDYGHLLNSFLSSHQLSEDYVFLSELAYFEWSFREVFHLKQNIGLSPSEVMAFIENEDARNVQLVSTARLIQFNFSITSLYALKDLENDSQENTFDYTLPEFILMYKDGILVKTFTLSKNQFLILQKLLAPAPLLTCLQKAPATVTPDEIQSLFTILGSARLLLKFD